MKKIFAIIMTVFLLASTLYVGASALTVSTEDVIRVSGLKKGDDTGTLINGYTDFAEGWDAAVRYADDGDFMDENEFVRIVVDLRADWKADAKGEFGKSGWKGFQYTTIYVPDDLRITINMNGYTIDRGLTTWEWNGEVICIGDDADVIINNGTIRGGFSGNGAGGLHICEDANVTLNNVNLCYNRVEDDSGSAIALLEGATLTMNGGSISNNTTYLTSLEDYAGSVYIDEAKASFKEVTFENNQGVKFPVHGAVMNVDDGTVVMENCKVIGNGLEGKMDDVDCVGAFTIIDISTGSDVTIKNTEFSGNGAAGEVNVNLTTRHFTSVIRLTASNLTIGEKCDFSDNNQVFLLDSVASILDIRDTDFSGNKSFAFFGYGANGYENTFTNCTFSYTEPMLGLKNTFHFSVNNTYLTFVDCEFGDAIFNNKSAATFVDTDAPNGSASIFGEGSLATVVSFIALIASLASIVVNVTTNKKRLASADDNGGKASDDEE